MNKSLFLISLVGLITAACNYPQREVDPTRIATATAQASEPPVSSVLTVEPTLATLQLAVYPPETRTGIEELDAIIDAVLRHDVETLRSLTRYLVIGCTHAEGLGGSPKCNADEAEGTLVEVMPLMGPEGHHQRRAQFEQWPGPDALGLLAAYRVGPRTYSDEPYPAGEYGLTFLEANVPTVLTLQVSNGRVIRFDYSMGGTIESDLEREADSFLLPLAFQPIPTAVSWITFLDPGDRFRFVYPPSMTLSAASQEDTWRLGDQIEIFLRAPGPSFVACFDQALGDCPAVQEDVMVTINGVEARRVKGYFGAIGGMIPQEFLTYVFEMGGKQLVFTLYALPFDAEMTDITQIWPLPGMELELFERIVGTVTVSSQ